MERMRTNIVFPFTQTGFGLSRSVDFSRTQRLQVMDLTVYITEGPDCTISTPYGCSKERRKS
jgi:hypothetical protein